jgi:acyl carrier protein
MTNDEVHARVLEVIADQLGADPEDLHPDARFVDDLGTDSLDLAELMSAFEEEFQTSIGDDDMSWLETIEDAVAGVLRALVPQADVSLALVGNGGPG